MMRWLRRGGLLAAVILPGLAVAAQTPPAAPQGSRTAEATQELAGRVVSAADGHPIANATLTLSPQQRGRRQQGGPTGQSQSAQTDAQGNFRLFARTPGRYSLRATAPGYLGMLYLEHAGFSSAIVTGAGVRTDALQFALVPEASIRGRVLDDTGEPVRASLTLYRDTEGEAAPSAGGGDGEQRPATLDAAARRYRPAGGAQADDDGRYEFTGLQPGRYYLAASAMPWYAVHPRAAQDEEHLPYRSAIDPALDVAYPMTFYPHATTEQTALPILLKAGGRATANMLMQPERAVTLTVQVPAGADAGRDRMNAVPSLVHKVFGADQSSGYQIDRSGSTVLLTGIAPGQYTARSFNRPGGGSTSEVLLDLSAGSTTFVAPLSTANVVGDVSVALHAPPGEALPDDAVLELQRVGSARDREPLTGKVDQGAVQFRGVEAGEYRIRLHGDGQNWNVSRLTVDGKVVPTKVLHVDGDVKAELVGSPYAPEVDGFVHAADGKVHAGSLVVLVPAGADPGEDLYRADQSDLDGGFQFYNVLPGNYLLVAIDNDWNVAWHSAAALMRYLPHALPVTVATSGPRVVALQEQVGAQPR